MQESILSNQSEGLSDPIESTLLSISQNILIFVFGLLPLLFIPVPFIGADYLKTVVVGVAVLLAIVFYSLSVLRSGNITVSSPLALLGLWVVALTTSVSAIFSGDISDAFVGDDLGVHTAVFVILLALIATASLLILRSKEAITRLYILLTGSAVVLALFHLLRIVFGPNALSLGVFNNVISTPIGAWNDLALFFGLCILLSLVALQQLSLTRPGKILFGSVVVFSLMMLGIINFIAVWVVLALVSLIILMYGLTKDRFSEKTLELTKERETMSVMPIVLSVIVFIVSLVFAIGSGVVGGFISKATGISYVEVRPSLEATIDIARGVYSDNAFVGIGPNKFVDAWRLYKDPSINQTVFWATDFKGGNGYITTAFVTTGIAGVVAWLMFFGLYLFAGFKFIFRQAPVDRMWYFIGSSAFVASSYVWGMALLYVPGAAMLILGGIFTAILFITYAVVCSPRILSFSLIANKRAGIVLVGIVMVVIVGASSALYYVSRHYAAVYTFNSALQELSLATDIAPIEEKIASAYAIQPNDAFAGQLATLQLVKINALGAQAELNDEQKQVLQLGVQNGINAALTAVEKDPANAVYLSTLGSIYSVLAGAAVEGAQDRAREAFAKARENDPVNPLYVLLEAQLNSRVGDLEGARTKAQEAIALKPDYTDALFFLTQIDIAEGKTADAIATTEAIISIEPNNPARYYQLGVLHSAAGNIDASILAFERAVQLDANYANARYFLALAYAQKGNTEGAIEQLQVVLDLNPNNAEIAALLERLRSGEPLEVNPSQAGQVSEPDPVNAEDDAITTTEDPDTSLISPVNPIGQESEETEEAQ